jgi:hypothetical protein
MKRARRALLQKRPGPLQYDYLPLSKRSGIYLVPGLFQTTGPLLAVPSASFTSTACSNRFPFAQLLNGALVTHKR